MDLKINFHDRELEYSHDNHIGSGLNNLTVYSGQNRDKIKKIYVTGNSRSYTFVRQIYLFINLFKKINNCQIYLDDKLVTEELLLPKYNDRL